MNLNEIERASKILDYWFTIEFLSQDSLKTCLNFDEILRKANEVKELAEINDYIPPEYLNTCFKIEDSNSLYSAISGECNASKMFILGNITVYLGEVKRERCIETIIKYLKDDSIEIIEKNYDDIAIASFQMTPQGQYIENTFSLSTIVWAMSKLQNSSKGKISTYLSENQYKSDIRKLELKLKEILSAENTEISEITTYKNITIQLPHFTADSFSTKKINQFYSEINTMYLENIDLKLIDSKHVIYRASFQLFRNEKAKEKYDDDSYTGLSHDYYSEDIKMLKNLVERDRNNSTNIVNKDIISYINAPFDENKEWERVDLVKVENVDEFELRLHEVLNIKNAPIGKWPSRYTPAYMQQIAINFAIGHGTTDLFNKNGTIFSVNGPPGTGKTTLLKEIVVNNIVEKAKRLATYQIPDEAFVKHNFLKGNKKYKSYSKYVLHWYSLIDDSINDYSILVTSCNNAAVENISKELPLESGILNSLRTNSKDSELFKKQLDEIKELFSVEKSKIKEELYKRKSNENKYYQEIYLTGYAQGLSESTDVWGLVAAPLGKQSNNNRFYREVLDPLFSDFYYKGQFSKEGISIRLPKYKEAIKKFNEQLNKVETIQKNLSTLGDIALKAKQIQKKKKHEEFDYSEIIFSTSQKLDQIMLEKTNLENIIASLKEVLEEMNQSEKALNTAYESNKITYTQIMDLKIDSESRKLAAMKDTGFFKRIFSKKKYMAAENLIQSLDIKITNFHEEIENLNQTIFVQYESIKTSLIEHEGKNLELKEKELELSKLSADENELIDRIYRSKEKMAENEQELSNAMSQYEQAMVTFNSNDETHRGTILDQQFITELLSDDEKISTKAQVSNLWTTEYYNREREKLVYEALQLTREFVLTSKRCMLNLTTLSQYWGYKLNEDNEKIIYDKVDRERMVGSLFQTLFLLVPVVSSTFASVGKLLKDVKSSGVIGTLIVDEAGQAQPQMAVGALYRAKKAIIVGDPRQVEPVVLDDLQLIKQFHEEPLYRSYQNKGLSVQKCADIINPFGTYLENETPYPEWVGCPLLVHRRCISPMFEISNMLSYGGIMKQQTLPPKEEKEKNFVFKKSQWINCLGAENGNKDHFVQEQGKIVIKILEEAFTKSDFPIIYMISPFTSVVSGIRNYLKSYCKQNIKSAINKSKRKEDWFSSNIGTVHTFQGKEADEVIFLLGCDGSQAAEGAVKWVTSNIVNVAVTRAKYRLCIIGNSKAWENNSYISEAKAILDTYALKGIDDLQKGNFNEEEIAFGYKHFAKQIPSISSFPIKFSMLEEGEGEYLVDTDSFVKSLTRRGFANKKFTDEELSNFGFKNSEELEKLSDDLRENIELGMRVYYMLEPVYEMYPDLDASCCGILFCKALEKQFNINLLPGLKKIDSKLFGDSKSRSVMFGQFYKAIKDNMTKLGVALITEDDCIYDINWWTSFNEKFKLCKDQRNKCCHSGLFLWDNLEKMRGYGFIDDDESDQRNPKIGGVFFESVVGNKL